MGSITFKTRKPGPNEPSLTPSDLNVSKKSIYDTSPDTPTALMDSDKVPIWLTFNNKALAAFFSMAVLILNGLVTVKSSPTIWMSTLVKKWTQASQSSSANGSSIETIGYSLINSAYKSANCSPVNHLVGSESGFLKSKSYLPSW
ncbi:hypothetical protein WICPIJ_005135 [Wickerhamomyces pijperi]|uniref:Uncharacterized protein n=1 Tax=Wickerhamomyces pijperi TaxID=599730 RepID=A0A9P8Q6J5_WICPI|nr:hypothetical protein WICPIJ_005135 [Wickerhamomyces pijperi]